ncbi:MAG: HAD family phosphatase [Lewinellaceae bacterium]|nr:HAD family phosphatase [Lewinellaceae bacterium]
MEYKIIFTDIDGTLLDKNRELAARTIQEIGRIKDRVPVVLVSSRMPKAMRHIQQSLGIEQYPLICYNGGLVLIFHAEQPTPVVLLSVPIAVEITRKVYGFAQNTAIHVSLYLNDDWYVQSMDYWANREANNTKVQPAVQDFELLISAWERDAQGPHKIMCMGPEQEIDQLEDFLQKACGDELNIYRSKSTYLELSSKSVSKAVAIKTLLDQNLHYPLEEAMAFGDNYNDIEMLATVGLGITVANGNEALKKVAGEITASNIEDGVALSIAKYFK